jgi:serine/threonine-protein kinase RsbW
VEISDDGTPHNPLDAPEPDTDLALEDRSIGGLGIHLVRNLTTDLSYDHLGGRNMLTFTVTSKEQP